MLLKSLCAVQALMLSALSVHTIHLERQIQDKTPKIFNYNHTGEPILNNGPIISLPLNKSNTTIELLPTIEVQEDEGRNTEIDNLSDILGSQVQTTNDGPDNSLFGDMTEGTLNKAPKKKKKA